MANVLYGMDSTHKITLQTIIQHTRKCKKRIKKSLLVVDMPKDSYKNIKEAKKNAKLVMNLTKCDAVKLESNQKNSKIIKELVRHKIPVMGHIGLPHNLKKNLKLREKQRQKHLNFFKRSYIN